MPHTSNEDLEVFTARIGARLDAHFAKFAPAIAAINAGFAATAARRAVTTNPSPDRGGKRTR
jgi:hypothetical protein